jgi:N,N'-diacetyllegionaminate synthase
LNMKFASEIKIGRRKISPSAPCFIIAEAGVNHGGDIDLAYRLIDIAAGSGADAVKFQAFRTEHLILDNVEKAPYQKSTTASTESQFDMLKKLELKFEQYRLLKDHCKKKNILFLITPFDEASLEELEKVGVEAYKIASTDTTNLPFLKRVAKTRKPILLSTGMCYMSEVKAALEEIHPFNKKVVLLQCTANYPIKDEEANLNVITTFQTKFRMLTGYSDHSVGVGAAPYAVPMGAVVLEKHFTTDKSLPGPDHLASLSPGELKQFVQQVRHIEKYMGSFIKEPIAPEKKTRKSLQKCLVAAKAIKKGQVIRESDIIAKRTGGNGISPIAYRKVVGKKAKKNYHVNDII